MDESTQHLIQQIKDNCRWFFGHEVQVITCYNHVTAKWYAIVYPADCTMASASGNDIHFHCVSQRNRYNAVNAVLRDLNTRIGDRFSFGDAGQAPVLERQDAPCNCVQRTTAVAVVEHRVDVPVGSVNIEASGEPDQLPARITTDRDSLVAQPSATQDIWPVLEKIENLLEAIEPRRYHGPVETATLDESANMDPGVVTPDPPAHTPEQLVFPTDPLPVQGVSQLATETTGTDRFLSLYSSRPFIPAVGEMLAPTEDELEARMGDRIREEIRRVLAGALDSLAAPRQLGDAGGIRGVDEVPNI